jgi:2,3-bisphosphoglycerate-independent phosphoglycerate mutase
MTNQPLLLLILDGWGLREADEANAIALANPVNFNRIWSECPHISLDVSGEAVGLPRGQMGNSEVGHMNLGAGRVVYQELTRINKSIREGDFFTNPVLNEAIDHAKKNDKTLHLMGLVSEGGVHSSMDHLFALIDLCKQRGIEKVRVHAFLDGRDVPPRSAEEYLGQVEEKLLEADLPQVATLCGRYFAMDRDKRWERVEKAYNLLTEGEGRIHPLSTNAIKQSYAQDKSDEFVEPWVTDFEYRGMEDGDSVVFFNFRPDRAREITEAFTNPNFSGFERKKVMKDLYFACMTMYDEKFGLPVAYEKQKLHRLFGEIVSENGLKQLRTAETEKYAHVTFFFNGGFETPYPGEDRKLVASPKVATYDLQPEMSVFPVCEEVCNGLRSGEYSVIVCNFANPDMVGHTGVIPAAIEAVKAVDKALGQILDTLKEVDGTMLVTADHGNIELMVDPENGGAHTAHTTDLVPCVLVSGDKSLGLKDRTTDGQYFSLSNIAPTMLDILGLPIPPEMTSPSMLERAAVPA